MQVLRVLCVYSLTLVPQVMLSSYPNFCLGTWVPRQRDGIVWWYVCL